MSRIENEYKDHLDNEFAEFLEYKERKQREKGILPDGSPLGDSVHPDTVKSYSELELEVPDSTYLAARRPTERMKKIMMDMGKPLELEVSFPQIYRLKDRETDREFLVWNRHEEFKDANGNMRTLNYVHCGTHEQVEGQVHRNESYQITHSEVTEYKTIFDKPWSKKNYEELTKQKTGNGEGGQTEYLVGYLKKTGKDAVVARRENVYSIKNAEDFVNGKFEELLELGQRGLSITEPSLSKLKQPISEDPMISLHKRQRGYISPGSISYSQTSYR